MFRRLHNTLNFEENADLAYSRLRKYYYVQLLVLLFIIALSTLCASSLSQVNYNADSHLRCVLYSNWVFYPTGTKLQWISSDSNKTFQSVASAKRPILDLDKTEWGSETDCNFVQFSFAGSAVAAALFLCLFLYFHPVREAFIEKKNTMATSLIIPSIVVSFGAGLCCAIAAIFLTEGTRIWCQHLGDTLGTCKGTYSIREHALYVRRLTGKDYFDILLASQIFGWVAVVFWWTHFGIVAYRMFAHLDFPFYFFTNTVERENSLEQKKFDVESLCCKD